MQPSDVSPPSNGHLDLRSLHVAPQIKYLIQHGDSIGAYPSRSEALFEVLSALIDAGYDDSSISRLCLLETHGISDLPREKGPIWLGQELQRARRTANDLISKLPRPRPIIDGLLDEGMLLVTGKPIIGKSWLMLDLALAVATGNPVWKHFPTAEPQPMLYMALIDPRWRLQHRLRAIQPGIETSGRLQFLYDHPPLYGGGVERLRELIETWHYRLVVIDPLFMLAPEYPASMKYPEVYRLLAPLQNLDLGHPLCIALVMPLLRDQAEDVFDTLPRPRRAPHVLWALAYRSRQPVRTLHIRNDYEPRRFLHVSFAGQHWQCMDTDS